MWALLSKRLRMWLFFALAAPALGWLIGRVGDTMEARNGPSGVTRTLKKGRDWLRRRSRGPLAQPERQPHL